MNIKALIAVGAVGSLFAGGAALAEDYNNSPNSNLNQSQAQSSNWDATSRSNYEATVKAQGDQLDTFAQTATSQNVAATVDDSSSPVVTNQVIASSPVPDTPANRAKFGQPLSRAGKMTAPLWRVTTMPRRPPLKPKRPSRRKPRLQCPPKTWRRRPAPMSPAARRLPIPLAPP
jgi:hypothetical protein